MALHHNPRIVTSGLVLALDAADVNSYPGSGTTWKDLSGNGYNADISNYDNTPTFSSKFKGTFDFSSGARFYIDISALNNTNPYTVIWCGQDGGGDEYGGISRNEIWEPGNHLIGWQRGAINTDSGRDSNTNATGDEFIICHVNNTDNNSVDQYLNGAYYGTFIYTSWAAKERWTFGTRGDGAGHQYTGKMSTVQMYSRALSADEVLQNYEAQKTRFGL